MATLTYFVALPFYRNQEGEFRAGEAQECRTAAAAIQRAENMAQLSAGAIAFSRTGDLSTGEFEAAEVLRQFGEVPSDDLLRGYEDPELSLEDLVELLGISQPLVVRRMDTRDLPSRYIGAARSARLGDALALKEKIDAERRSMRETAQFF
jgi:hypothetical protein